MVREINIKPCLNGYILRVGCQTLVFTSRGAMIENLRNYYDNPDEVEKEFIENHKIPGWESVPQIQPTTARQEREPETMGPDSSACARRR